MKKTQEQRVKNRLKDMGEITRNECLRNRITRLAAIILILKNQGWTFETFDRDGDYVYRVKSTAL